MKSYRNERGVFYRTQTEAKASGSPFTMVDIPTSHAELIEFVNSLAVPAPAPEPEPEFIEIEATEEHAGRGLNDIWPGDTIKVRNPAYKNGDPTTPYMKSRDPRAVFTCRNCGVVNKPEPGQ